MFAKPQHGWTTFDYGGFEAECSYLVNIPVEWGEAICEWLSPDIARSYAVLPIDSEGAESYILLTPNCVYAVRDAEQLTVTRLSVSPQDFVIEFEKDFKKWMESWTTDFTTRMDDDTSEVRKHNQVILQTLDRLLYSLEP